MAGALVLALGVGCSHRAPIASCGDDLQGAWRDAAGARWMMLDNGATLEAYPIFADVVPTAPDVVAAPRVIDLTRTGTALAGTTHRRFDRRADSCDARAPVHVTACKDDTLELVLADPAPPVDYAPCRWGGAPPSHVERWRHD